MSRAVETFQLVQSGTTGTTTGTTTGADISTDGATVGTIQVDDASSGTFVVEVKARIHEDAEWQVLQVINQDNTGATGISIYLGLNS